MHTWSVGNVCSSAWDDVRFPAWIIIPAWPWMAVIETSVESWLKTGRKQQCVWPQEVICLEKINTGHFKCVNKCRFSAETSELVLVNTVNCMKGVCVWRWISVNSSPAGSFAWQPVCAWVCHSLWRNTGLKHTLEDYKIAAQDLCTK